MSLRDHRTGRNLVRTRNRQPDVVRKAGPHIKQTRYEPEVCPDCYGSGIQYDPHNCGDHPAICATCGGEGEV